MTNNKIINIIEIDSRDTRYQTGIARYMNILCANMPKNVFIFRIIFYRTPDLKNLSMEMKDDELSIIHPCNFSAQNLYPAIIAMLEARFRQMTNLIVKSNCLGVEGLAYAIRNNVFCRTIGVLHCVPNTISANGRQNPLFGMDHIISVCESTLPWLQSVGNTRPVSIIYNGINRPTIPEVGTDNDDTFRFIFANGMAPHKGFAKIVPAVRRVAAHHKIEVLVLGGCDDTGRKILDDNKDLPIKYVGLVTNDSEIGKYYQQADCALFASCSEACSFAGIEAMAYNLPIISTNAPGLYEMFGAKGALYVAMDGNGNINTDEYAVHMINIIENKRLRTKLAVAAYARYLQRYTAKKMADSTLKLYYDLLK